MDDVCMVIGCIGRLIIRILWKGDACGWLDSWKVVGMTKGEQFSGLSPGGRFFAQWSMVRIERVGLWKVGLVKT